MSGHPQSHFLEAVSLCHSLSNIQGAERPELGSHQGNRSWSSSWLSLYSYPPSL